MLIVFSAGALAFIVLYNLTNINITERTREIATVKVLGFFPRETALPMCSRRTSCSASSPP